MPRIRHISIKNFRCIRSLDWFPDAGINCIIGPGDSGKSTILDAIDLCLGVKRNISFSDSDFYKLDVGSPIVIEVTIGDLDDALQNLDSFGFFLRGFLDFVPEIQDEPEKGYETVLTIQLRVESDLEPAWSLFSERAAAQGQVRSLGWADRLRLAPTRVGAYGNHDLSWRKGSVLNRLSEERADAAAAMLKVSRDARGAFGEEANEQLQKTREIVAGTAKALGVNIGDAVKAMLDHDSVSVGGGTISLHDEHGVPLRYLGTGSVRLLVSGLQREAASGATTILVDELEHGLEPHRIHRLLGSLGAKESPPPLQVFMTTHSPVVVRELSGRQLNIVRKKDAEHEVRLAGSGDDIQGTTRLYPEAFLASAVIVCEGATEVGFLRGFDQFKSARGKQSITAMGVALVDGGGSDKLLGRALAFQSLGYKTALFRDDDVQPDANLEKEFADKGGAIFKWRQGNNLESEIFSSLSDEAVARALQKAVDYHGEDLVNAHLKTASKNAHDLNGCRSGIKPEHRATLAKAAAGKQTPWFKSISFMEEVARDVVAPDDRAEVNFRTVVANTFKWAGHED
jgi:predicted ATPase